MKVASLFIASILLFQVPAIVARARNYQANFVLTGHIVTPNRGARFNIKLYPPKKSGRPVLLTTSDNYGNFRFTGLSASSYLLEIYLGSDMVNQQVVAIDGNKEITIKLS
jgi:hypothetical protein